MTNKDRAADLVRRLAHQQESLLALVSLFHSTYTWERIWYSIFSLSTIVLSALLTFVSALSLALPELDPRLATIPSLVMSFMITVAGSVVKFFNMEARMSESKAEADHLRGAVAALETRRAALEQRLATDEDIKEPPLQLAEAALTAALEQEHLSSRSLLQLRPSIVLAFEKEQLTNNLKRNKRKLSDEAGKLLQQTFEDVRDMYQKLLAKASTDPSCEEMSKRLEGVKKLLQLQTTMMVLHADLSDRASNFDDYRRRRQRGRRVSLWTRLCGRDGEGTA